MNEGACRSPEFESDDRRATGDPATARSTRACASSRQSTAWYRRVGGRVFLPFAHEGVRRDARRRLVARRRHHDRDVPQVRVLSDAWLATAILDASPPPQVRHDVDAADRAPASRRATRRACATRWAGAGGREDAPPRPRARTRAAAGPGRRAARRTRRSAKRVEDALPVRPVPVRRRLLARARDRRRAQPEGRGGLDAPPLPPAARVRDTGPWEHFFRMFMAGDVGHGRGSTTRFVRRRAPAPGARLLWVTFENLKDDLPRELARIAVPRHARGRRTPAARVAASSPRACARPPAAARGPAAAAARAAIAGAQRRLGRRLHRRAVDEVDVAFARRPPAAPRRSSSSATPTRPSSSRARLPGRPRRAAFEPEGRARARAVRRAAAQPRCRGALPSEARRPAAPVISSPRRRF